MPSRDQSVTARSALGTLLVLLLWAWPAVAHADDLGVLIYLLVVWPLALLLLAAMVVMIIIAAVKLRRGTGGRRAGYWIIGISVLLTALHIVVNIIAYTGVRTKSKATAVISILPVLVPGIVNVILWWRLVRRGKPAPPR